MNRRFLLLFTSCSAFLIASTAALSQTIIQKSIQSTTGVSTTEQCKSIQNQETVISLDSANLQQPYTLRVSAPEGTQLTGQITLNDKVVEKFEGNQASINLSPQLSKGKQAIKISGTYKPANSSVEVELSGPGTQITQEVSGEGKLDQTLVLNVS